MTWHAAALLGISLALAPAERPPALQSLLDELHDAQRTANRQEEGGIQALRAALAKFEDHAPALARDKEARKQRLTGQLMLARILLNAGDTDGARLAIDEGIRLAPDEELETYTFGPSLHKLHEERRAELSSRGLGAIEVRCAVPCSVYLDEAEAGPHEEDLLLGQYRLWVEPRGPAAAEPLRRAITIGTANETVMVRFPPDAPLPEPTSQASDEPAPPAEAATDRGAKESARLLPRWAEITGLVVGGLATGAGATLIGIDGKCTRADPCEDVFRTETGGIAVLAAGGAVMVTAAILLTIDEIRLRKGRSRERAGFPGPWLRF